MRAGRERGGCTDTGRILAQQLSRYLQRGAAAVCVSAARGSR